LKETGVHLECGGPALWITEKENEAALADPEWVPCCWGAINEGPIGCTCWVPVLAVEQPPIVVAEPTQRHTMCDSCAYRLSDPTRASAEWLDDNPHRDDGRFYCHQGLPQPIAWVHPDGRRVETPDSADWQETTIDGVPYRADGTPADLCAGWLAERKRARR
jgi:hypothetical protein